jgi:hypothetical protein
VVGELDERHADSVRGAADLPAAGGALAKDDAAATDGRCCLDEADGGLGRLDPHAEQEVARLAVHPG